MAVQLGYKNVYRYPEGYPAWQAMGLPVASTPVPSEEAARAGAEPKAPGPLYGWAMLLTLLGVFAGGMALNLTPCVYPLIPITISYFGGRSGNSKGRLVVHGLCYMGGLAFTNSMLGVVAALTGGLMGAMLRNPIVLVAVAAVLVLFSSSLFGFWELRLPQGLTQAASKSYAGYFGTLFMGMAMGVVAAPCIGPFVLGLLTWVASMGSPWLGFIIFFTLSLGLGLPLFVLAIFSGQLEKLPRSGEWMLWIRKLMGWVLIGMAAYFVRPLFPARYGVLLFALLWSAAGLHLGWLDKTQADSRTFARVKRVLGSAALIFAVLITGTWALRGPGVSWQPYTEGLLMKAKNEGKPAIIDFSATWCSPCRKLEEDTFHDPVIVRRADDFVMIKVDVTRSGNPVHERLLRQYDVKGVPTIVFLDRQGKERGDLRLVDYLPPAEFVKRMTELVRSGTLRKEER